MNGSNVTFTDADVILEKLNGDLARFLIPNNVILAFYFVLGFTGNLTVIIVYGFRMKENRDRFFIPYLAVIDLIACVFAVAFGISQNVMQLTFRNDGFCKAGWFLQSITQTMSAFMLIIIAVHRYLKVCKPLGGQMTLGWKKFALALAFIVALILSSPVVVFYGSVPYFISSLNITTYTCNQITENKHGAVIYSSIWGVIGTINILSIICMYSRIGYTLLKHFKTRRELKNCQNMNIPNDDSKSRTELSTASLDECDSTEKPPITGTLDVKKETSSPSRSLADDKSNRQIMRRFTTMFMMISGVYLLCYIPVCILIFLDANDPTFWTKFNDNERRIVLIVFRLYIINNIANPIIYAFMDTQFRKELRNIFCKRSKG